MRRFTFFLSLCLVFLVSRQAAAGDDDGPFVMLEFNYLTLKEDDNYAWSFRGVGGYTFKPGFQLGGGLSGFYLSKPSVLTEAVADPCGLCPPEAREEDLWFAALSPMLGWDIRLVDGWFGLHVTAIPSFPFTEGVNRFSWSIEGGISAYFSFQDIAGDIYPTLFGGIKASYFDYEIDYYELRQGLVHPTWGAAVHFH